MKQLLFVFILFLIYSSGFSQNTLVINGKVVGKTIPSLNLFTGCFVIMFAIKPENKNLHTWCALLIRALKRRLLMWCQDRLMAVRKPKDVSVILIQMRWADYMAFFLLNYHKVNNASPNGCIGAPNRIER